MMMMPDKAMRHGMILNTTGADESLNDGDFDDGGQQGKLKSYLLLWKIMSDHAASSSDLFWYMHCINMHKVYLGRAGRLCKIYVMHKHA